MSRGQRQGRRIDEELDVRVQGHIHEVKLVLGQTEAEMIREPGHFPSVPRRAVRCGASDPTCVAPGCKGTGSLASERR